MSRRAIKAINWSAFAELIPESERASFHAFKSQSDQYYRRMTKNSETAPQINWSFYKSNIPAIALVEKFQKEYEALKIPYPEDKYSTAIDQAAKENLKDIETYIAESNERIKESEKAMKRLRSLMPYGQMTMEDFAEAHPDEALDMLNRPSMWPHTPEMADDYPCPYENKEH